MTPVVTVRVKDLGFSQTFCEKCLCIKLMAVPRVPDRFRFIRIICLIFEASYLFGDTDKYGIIRFGSVNWMLFIIQSSDVDL